MTCYALARAGGNGAAPGLGRSSRRRRRPIHDSGPSCGPAERRPRLRVYWGMTLQPLLDAPAATIIHFVTVVPAFFLGT